MTKYTVKQSFYDEQLGQFSRGEVLDSENFTNNTEAFTNVQQYMVEGEVDLQLQDDLQQLQERSQAMNTQEPSSPQIPNAQASYMEEQAMELNANAMDVNAIQQQEVKRANRKAND